ncbi:hypothetical protein LXL04_013506 [Taraxacum kok-saghyz]
MDGVPDLQYIDVELDDFLTTKCGTMVTKFLETRLCNGHFVWSSRNRPTQHQYIGDQQCADVKKQTVFIINRNLQMLKNKQSFITDCKCLVYLFFSIVSKLEDTYVVRNETVSHEHTTHAKHKNNKIYSGSVQSPTYVHSRCHLEEDQLLLLTEDQLWLHIQQSPT